MHYALCILSITLHLEVFKGITSMYVKKLYAKNFRNIKDEQITFQSGINVLYGKNASGKTNALEAVYLFASGKSLRGSPEKDFISKGESSAKISLDFCSSRNMDVCRSMSLSLLGGNRKIMKYGYSDIPKMSEFLGHFRACTFTPDDLMLVKGSPEERRRFADISISQISPTFVRCLNDYPKILSQKNAILKKAQISGNIDKVYMEILNTKLAESSAVIVKQRAGFCENLQKYAKDIYRNISDEREIFGMKYVSRTKKNYGDEEFTKNAYFDIFSKGLEREMKYGVSLEGPHKDDIYFYIGKDAELERFERDCENGSATDDEIILDTSFMARAFGSRGQQRSVVLSLKLAQGELFRELCGEYPVFLLDDVFSELDYARRSYILSNTQNKQIIITCCDCDILGSFTDYNGIKVSDGKYTSDRAGE